MSHQLHNCQSFKFCIGDFNTLEGAWLSYTDEYLNQQIKVSPNQNL